KKGGDVFTDVDEEMVVALAAAAGIAIDNARHHARVADLALFEDRERIARDLHDTVIQRLFATGLSLQGAARLAEDRPQLLDRLQSAVDDLDATVRQVRSAIFELHTARLPGRSVRQEALDICAESARALGFEPVVRFDGPIDSTVDDRVADHLIPVLREALSNVARHGAASTVEVTIVARDGWLTMRVVYDGRGRGDGDVAVRGLDNMRVRAKRLGGDVDLTPVEPRGAALEWKVPLK